MHGRLKIKTSAEKEAEKQKEREIKKNAYLAGVNILFTKRKEGKHDEEGLKVGAGLLAANPDALTLWNIRRETLLALKCEDESRWRDLLLSELNTTEACLLQNPKSYGAWHHRDWLFRVMPSPPYLEEIQLCDRYLTKDERNFHCWDHRRLIVNRSGIRTLDQEISYTQSLIERNFSNFSAWHYRSQLLPITCPPEPDSHLPIAERAFIEELQRVLTAVFTDPADQSPWFFLRWLLSPCDRNPRLLESGLITWMDKPAVVFVYDKESSNPCTENEFIFNGERLGRDQFEQYNSDKKFIWILKLDDRVEGDLTVIVRPKKDSGVGCDKEIKIHFDSSEKTPCFRAISRDPFRKAAISENAKKALNETIDNCQSLDDIDPGNKWVLLTLVNTMATIDLARYEPKILDLFRQLEQIDPLRVNYYRDTRSKYLLKSRLQNLQDDRQRAREFDGSNLELTRLSYAHHLASFQKVNFSNNSVRSTRPLTSLIGCTRLILDGNPLESLDPVIYLPHLIHLSMKSCRIDSIDDLKKPSGKSHVEELRLEGNPVAKKDGVENDLRLLFPSLNDVFL